MLILYITKTSLEGGLDPDQHSMATLDPGSALRFLWIQIRIHTVTMIFGPN
jgi:hypothetical protein